MSLWEQGAKKGLEKGTKEYAKYRLRVNSKKHVIYPEACNKPGGYAYWHGVKVLRDEHKASCRSNHGNTTIFCGDPGSGKSTAVNSIVHGESGLQPDRSLTLRCHIFNRRSTTDDEKITQIKKMLHLGKEDKMDVFELATGKENSCRSNYGQKIRVETSAYPTDWELLYRYQQRRQ
jgi:hypothetical protein